MPDDIRKDFYLYQWYINRIDVIRENVGGQKFSLDTKYVLVSIKWLEIRTCVDSTETIIGHFPFLATQLSPNLKL